MTTLRSDNDALPNDAWNADDRLGRIIDILVRDYDSMRTEIRTVLGTHEKTSFWLSSGLIIALAACFKTEFNIGFAFLPLVILAYHAHRLHRHTLHIKQLSQWVMRIEALIDKLIETDGLLEWERGFVRHKLKNFELKSLFSSHWFAELYMLAPGFVVYFVCVYKSPQPIHDEFGLSITLAKCLLWGGYAMLLVLLWGGFAFVSTKDVEKARDESIAKLFASIIDHPSWQRRPPTSDASPDNVG